MALTQDQATRLDEAISNLNKSVEINNQILEMLRSLGNTGVVDIATHNTDKTAHSDGFNTLTATNLYALNSFISKIDPSTPDYNSLGIGKLLVESNDNRERAVIQLFGGYKNGYTTDASALRFYLSNDDFSNSFLSKELGTISFYSRYAQDSSQFNATTTMVAMRAATDEVGNASFYIGVRSSEGVNSQYYFKPLSLYPTNGNSSLGSSTFQWKDCYLQSSPIVSSDERLKQDIEEVPEEVFKAWARVNFKQYRFKEAVASKGDDARKHVGLIAQHILAAFEAEGLDATAYGIVCHDEWDDQYSYETVIDAEAVYDKDGKVVTPEKSHTEKRFVKAAGDVWTVRYEEALALETAYQRWRLAKIEAVLAEKGITL